MSRGVQVGNAQYIGARGEQQDYFGITDEENADFIAHGGVLAAVADGVGGHAHGGEASQVAVREFLRVYKAKSRAAKISDALYVAVKAANQAVCEFAEARGEAGNCGTTLTAAALHPESRALHWVSVGDSRLYLLRGGEWVQITVDGNNASLRLRKTARGDGPQDAPAADRHGRALTSFLGLKHFCEIDRSVRPFAVQPGDWLVLCTDGIFNALGAAELVGCLHSQPRAACELLVRSVLAKGIKNQDNCTVAILAYGLPDAPAEAPPPPPGGLWGRVKTRMGLRR